MDVDAVQDDVAGHPAAFDGIVHAVETADEGGFAAARRPDHGQHLVAADIDRDVLDRLLVPVVDVDVAADHARVVDRDGADRLALFAADPRPARIPAAFRY